MTISPLLDQAEIFLSHYPSNGDVHPVFRALIDGARANDIPEDVRLAATRLQSNYPGSTISLLIQKILNGSTEKIDQWDLRRWIAATDSEKGPTHAARSRRKSFADLDSTKPGPYVVILNGEEYHLIIEQTAQGFSARFPAFPECTTWAPSAIEALTKAQNKLRTHIERRAGES